MYRRPTKRQPPTTWPKEGLAKIEDACQFLAVGRSTVYDAIKAGRLPAVSVMTDCRIPWPALHDLAKTPR